MLEIKAQDHNSQLQLLVGYKPRPEGAIVARSVTSTCNTTDNYRLEVTVLLVNAMTLPEAGRGWRSTSWYVGLLPVLPATQREGHSGTLGPRAGPYLSLIHISEPTRPRLI
eukprot:4638446-Amphidinium_carterae.1